MKKIVLVLAVLFVVQNPGFSQNKEPYEMMVNGVKVIVQPSNNEIVEIQAIFKGGLQNYPTNKVGIENLAINGLTECGTVNDDKNSFKNKLDKVSAQISGYASFDRSVLSLNCIQGDLGAVWPLFADALTVPAFNEKEFERIKQDAINNIRSWSSDPDYSIEKFAREVAFRGMNYAKDPAGTEASVSKLTADETKKYYHTLATKAKMFFVVVGDIEREKLESMFLKLIEKIPDGKAFTTRQEYYNAKSSSFTAQKKDLATNYIHAITTAPPPGTKDYDAYVLAMRIFYDRHFLEVRTNNGLSYAPYTYFEGGLTPSTNIGVSTTEPNKYIKVLNDLVTRTKQKGFTEAEVKNMKTTYITSKYYEQETNSAQAYALALNETLHNNWRRAITLNEDLKKVTAKDVSNAFNKYISTLTWVYQGDPAKVNPSLYMQAANQPKLPPSSLNNKKTNK
jgi:predicted Zn-dependent peptidase